MGKLTIMGKLTKSSDVVIKPLAGYKDNESFL